jgi:hypothetical protein
MPTGKRAFLRIKKQNDQGIDGSQKTRFYHSEFCKFCCEPCMVGSQGSGQLQDLKWSAESLREKSSITQFLLFTSIETSSVELLEVGNIDIVSCFSPALIRAAEYNQYFRVLYRAVQQRKTEFLPIQTIFATVDTRA